MKNRVYTIATLCIFMSFLTLNIFATGKEDTLDRYGIPVSLIDSTRYGTALKKRIRETRVYNADFYDLLTKHYCMLLGGVENVDDYTSFYRECSGQTTDLLLKAAFQQRLVRGLFRKEDTKVAESEFKKIDLAVVKSNLYEHGYYKILLTYVNSSKLPLEKRYDNAVLFYGKNKLFGFDLASIYNNFGMYYSGKDNSKAYSMYKKGIHISKSKEMLKCLLINIKSLAASDQNLKKQIQQDVFPYLAAMKDNNQKLKLMICMLATDFWGTDIRKQRRLMDLIYPSIEKSQDPVLLFDAYCILALKEEQEENYADIIPVFLKCRELCVKNKWKNHLIYIDAYIYCAKCDMNREKLSFEKINMITEEILACEYNNQKKITLLSAFADECVLTKDFKSYLSIFAKVKKHKFYSVFAVSYAENISMDIFNDVKKYSVDDIKIILQPFDQNIIQKVSPTKRASISLSLYTCEEKQLAKLWEPSKNSNFYTEMMAIEYLMSLKSIENTKKALSMLDTIVPREFSIKNYHFSKEDADAWIQNDRLAIYIEANAYHKYKPILIRLEELLPKCSSIFADICVCNVGSAYVTLGEIGKAIPLLTYALSKFTSEGGDYAKLSLILGLAYMHIGNTIDAIKYCRTARRIFKQQCNHFFYVRSSINLALAITRTDNPNIDEVNRILDECISIANKNCYSDDLSRAYCIKMSLIEKNNKLTRKEKIKKITEIENKCVATTTNPTILAQLFYEAAKLKHAKNFSAICVVTDIEKYFQNQKLFSSVLSTVDEKSLLVQRDKIMKDMLFEILEEIGDTKRIDYWNKVFERDRTRTAELQAQQEKGDTRLLSILALVSKFEDAQQILTLELSKKEVDQDKNLIFKARNLKKEIEQQYELARKSLSEKDTKIVESLITNNFIIHPDSLSQLSSVLPSGVACLQFLNVGDKIIAYIAVKDAPPFSTSISLKDKDLTRKQFSQKLIKVRNLLQNRTDSNTLKKELNGLYSVLFSELTVPLEKLKVKSLIINASGILRYIPFSALYDGKSFLVEKYQVTNITGLDLIRLAKNNNARSIADVKAAIFADPDGSLPSGRKEGTNIAQLFANKKLYLGDKASLAEFESMAGNVNFVHLATHAVLDPNEPGKSYIQFADGKKWYYSDMMGFNIQNVDSIALSACETAVGEKSTGGEIEGMAYQLLKKSPSGSVLATLWEIDDRATGDLMVTYYKHITDSIRKNHTLDRGGALREAQLKLLRNPATSHPYYWAAFTLFGDFR